VSDSNPSLRLPSWAGGRRGRADSALLSTPAALRASSFGHHLAAALPTGPQPTQVTSWGRTRCSSTSEGWPLSMRSVAGPNAACRAPSDDPDAATGITTVSRPVPCGADVLPLFLLSGEPYHPWSRRFPLTFQLFPNRPKPSC
jgi:hypothetical protein